MSKFKVGDDVLCTRQVQAMPPFSYLGIAPSNNPREVMEIDELKEAIKLLCLSEACWFPADAFELVTAPTEAPGPKWLTTDYIDVRLHSIKEARRIAHEKHQEFHRETDKEINKLNSLRGHIEGGYKIQPPEQTP